MELSEGLQNLLMVGLVAALAPLVVGLLPFRVPQVVLLIVGGIVIGPQVLDWAHTGTLSLLSNVGLGFLFLLAGYELELNLFTRQPGFRALAAWFISMGLAIAVTGALAAVGYVEAFVPVALGLTTTALGTLLPILHDNGMLRGSFGEHILAAGAVGEFFPVLGIAVFLGTNGEFLGLLSLIVMALLGLLLTVLPRLARSERLRRIIREGEHSTSQTTLRWTVVLLLGLLLVAEDFGLDVVLGAFLAGVILRRWAPGDVRSLEGKLDALGYGFFIPIFFVTSGMDLDLDSIAKSPDRLLVFFLLLLAVRGVPAMLVYRGVLPLRQRVQMMLLTATALPLLVALSTIGLDSGHMLPENAAALVGAGVLSVMVFPALAQLLQIRGGTPGDKDGTDNSATLPR